MSHVSILQSPSSPDFSAETAVAPFPKPFSLVGKHLPALDGIRGLAILVVVACHFAGQFRNHVSGAPEQFIIAVMQAGWIGVDLFFVLSGFLITGILIDTRHSPNYFTSFYGRRVLRIFPAYYATLAGLLIVLPAVARRLPGNLGEMSQAMVDHQAWFWCYAVNWFLAWQGTESDAIPGTYFWSLAVEEQFYIVWPFVVLWLGKDRLRRLIFVLLPVFLVSRWCLLAAGVAAESLYFATLTHLDGMLAGALVAIYLRTPQSTHVPGRRFTACAAAGAGALVGLGSWQGHFYFWDPAVVGVGFSLLAACFAWLLLATVTARAGAPWVRFFMNPVLRSFGKYSYSIYLLHVPIGLVLHKVFSPAQLRFNGSHIPAMVLVILAGTAISWLVGFLSWHLFEKQFLKLKSFFEYDDVRVPSEAAVRVSTRL